jgi:hypothetical protein
MTDPSAKAEAALIAAETARRKAMTDGDAAAMDGFLADHFYYAHINGEVDDREGYLNRLRRATVKYLSSEMRDVNVVLRNGYAMLSGISKIDFENYARNTEGTVETLFLTVWESTPSGWRISAYSSTPLPPA